VHGGELSFRKLLTKIPTEKRLRTISDSVGVD
jgi:hypothetical protein